MTRGVAGISGFLEKARVHVTETGGDKYARDRKHEPADVLSEWFPNDPFLWNCGKYLSRLPRTKKETDFFKALHYLGMQYNLVFGKPPDVTPPIYHGPLAQDTLFLTATGRQFGKDWIIEKHTSETPKFLDYLMQCLEVFDARHKVRGPDNINEIGVEGCLDHVKEKVVRAKVAWAQIQVNAGMAQANGGSYKREQDPVWKDFIDSCIDAANFALIAFMKARGDWPSNRTVQDTGVPV